MRPPSGRELTFLTLAMLDGGSTCLKAPGSIILGGLMALLLILRRSGITGGRELRLPRRRTA